MDKNKRSKGNVKKRTSRRNSRPVFALLFAILAVFALRGRVGLIRGDGIPRSPDYLQSSPDPQPSPDNQRPRPSPSGTDSPQNDIPQPNEYCTLVNRKNPLTEDFQVETREIICNGTSTGKNFDVRVIDKLEKMLSDAAAAGYPMLVRSAHRSISYQKMLYTNKVNDYLNAGYTQSAAESEAAKWVAPPGTSEHNLGIVIDVVNQGYTGELEQYFEETDHFTWLYEHCADYGFILRYPKGKESVTGIVYEPWHYRYVGEDVAKYIMENNLTLEEYWEEV